MITMTIEMLTPERVTELWPVLEPHFDAACKGNEIAKDTMDAKDIYVLAVTGLVAVFVGFENGEPACVLGIQFNTANGHKCADVMALAGHGLTRFKAAYWNIILEWLKANGVKFLDAYAPERLAKIYMKRFGFNKSCTYVRMTL
tara:strand:+ start:111 stop:542 length:432 start_codon:yes stop_codon:yes gene_type:complete